MKKIIVVGGGPAGFFAAITAKEMNSENEVVIIEKSPKLLAKVKISGGGRCNVTHACFDPKTLTTYYPRGGRELLSPFTRFQPADTIEWFAQRGVQLKTESDGRMFPVSNSSSEIVNCLLDTASRLGVVVRTSIGVINLTPLENDDSGWVATTDSGEKLFADKLIIAAGSSHGLMDILNNIGYRIETPVPSLFTFNISDPFLKDLQGISQKNVSLAIMGTKLKDKGPLLITHWGLSGPAILRLSAWGARILHAVNYNAALTVNWTGSSNEEQVYIKLTGLKKESPDEKLASHSMYSIASKLWLRFLEHAHISATLPLKDTSLIKLRTLAQLLTRQQFAVEGKSTFKEEFVTCGGVNLKQINFATMESRLHKNIYFAGEILDIDAVTGGFNFQACWTTGWIAGKEAAS